MTSIRLLMLCALGALTVPAQDSDLMQAVESLKKTPEELKKNHPLAGGSIAGALGMGKKQETPSGPSKELIQAAEESAKTALRREADEKARRRRLARQRAVTQQEVAVAQHAVAEERYVSEEQLSVVSSGMARDQVVAQLGKPSFSNAIAGLEGGPRETLVYKLDRDRTVSIRVLDGKVDSVQR